MQKVYLLLIVFLLAACSDGPSSDGKWVAQGLPNEKKEQAPTINSKVAIYTPTSNTVGYVIKQEERDKWLLVNAEQVASHPYSLVHEELLTLGETYAIDEEHNIAIIHIRNSYNYAVEEISTFKTKRHGGEIIATEEQIETLLNEAVDKKINWQQRIQKNQQLLKNTGQQPIENFTTYYQKNIFTYNVDELKTAAMTFIEKLNSYVLEQNKQTLITLISSDDVLHELQYLSSPIGDFKIKSASKEGVYYFVTGIDKQKNDVRITFINEQQKYKVIGANFLSDEKIQQQKVPHIVVTEETTLRSLPALQMFLHKHIAAIKITVGELNWQLKREDQKIAVTNGAAKFSCDSIAVEDNHLAISGCKNTKNENYIIATFN